MRESIMVPVKLDEKTFRRFALYDVLIMRKGLRNPLVFASILLLSALAAFLLHREGSMLITGVLLAVGLGLPCVYLGSFFLQIRKQARMRKLTPARSVYTVTLSENGIVVENRQKEEAHLQLKWDGMWRAVRAKGCVYLYASEKRAFLLPNGQGSVPDEQLWDFIRERMGEERCIIAGISGISRRGR